jgi:hypothetical protein
VRKGKSFDYSRLSTNFEADVLGGCLGVVDSLGASLNVTANTVVVRSSESAHVSETVEGDSVFGSAVAEGGSVTRDTTLGNVVSAFSTEKETIAAEDGVCSEGGSLRGSRGKNRF